jgi:hypothetical protein
VDDVRGMVMERYIHKIIGLIEDMDSEKELKIAERYLYDFLHVFLVAYRFDQMEELRNLSFGWKPGINHLMISDIFSAMEAEREEAIKAASVSATEDSEVVRLRIEKLLKK